MLTSTPAAAPVSARRDSHHLFAHTPSDAGSSSLASTSFLTAASSIHQPCRAMSASPKPRTSCRTSLARAEAASPRSVSGLGPGWRSNGPGSMGASDSDDSLRDSPTDDDWSPSRGMSCLKLAWGWADGLGLDPSPQALDWS